MSCESAGVAFWAHAVCLLLLAEHMMPSEVTVDAMTGWHMTLAALRESEKPYMHQAAAMHKP